MTVNSAVPQPVTYTVTSRFLDSIAWIDYLFTKSPDKARREFERALKFATPEDQDVLVRMVGLFTRYPYRNALKALKAWYDKASPDDRERIDACRPFTNPHLYGRTVSTPAPEQASEEDSSPIPPQTWSTADAPVPPPTGPADRARCNKVLARMVDLLSHYPYESALERIADLRKLATPADRERLDACIPTADPGLYQPADPAAELDVHPKGLDASQWQPLPTRMRNRASVLSRPVPADIQWERLKPEKVAARQKQRAKRRPVREPQVVTDYFEQRAFIDAFAELADADGENYYVRRRASQYALEASRAKKPGNDKPKRARRGDVRDAEVAREFWDRYYVTHIGGQIDRDMIERGRHPVSEDHTHRLAEARTMIRISVDQRPEIPYGGNGLDYDHAAARGAVAGWPCVSCFIERPLSHDRAWQLVDGTWRSDDGLCATCRLDERPGLPALRPGFTNLELLLVRCTYFATNYPRIAFDLLDRVRRSAPDHPQAKYIQQFLEQHADLRACVPDAEPAEQPAVIRRRNRGPALGAGQRNGFCEGCRTYKPVHNADNLCGGCRVAIGIVKPAKRASRRAA
ncbi:hypothetical protein [Nocardia abscessus]|uniref:hypothetical protein n=1 Tax=Nocardia abscessus TaxID=120957 RepID=UPI0024568047|nr:hypothetical protein [Nocardia abscessus]